MFDNFNLQFKRLIVDSENLVSVHTLYFQSIVKIQNIGCEINKHDDEKYDSPILITY